MTEDARDELEEARHARALALEAGSATSAELVALLGDPSWRVRKAALSRVEHLRSRGDLVPALIASLGEPENAGLRSACAEALVLLGDSALPELVRALSTPDVDIRKFVVEVLGSSRSARARDALVRALDDPDENVRAAVISALAQLGQAEVLPTLRALVAERASDPQLTAFVLHALARLGAELSFEELEPLTGRPELARLTFALLGRCRDARASARLVAALSGGTRGARAEAVRALAEQRSRLDAVGLDAVRRELEASPAALGALEQALEDADDAVAESAAVVLGLVADPARAVRILAAAAARPFVKTAVEAVRPLGARLVPPLLQALDTASTEARVLSLEIIESVGDATATPRLLSVAAGVEPRAAEAAVSALGKLGGPGEVEPLMTIAREAEPELVRQISLALAAIGMRHPAEVAERIRRAVTAGDVRPVWIVILGLIGRDEDRASIVAASHHRDPEVRRAAVESFVGYGERVGEDVVVLALTDENPGVRAAAARALGVFRGERVVDALLVSTRDGDPLVVAEALRALGTVGGSRAASTLLTAAASSSAPVAIAALQSLFRLRPAGIETAVRRALAHADPEVVREGIVLTMRLDPAAVLPLVAECLDHRSWHVRLAAVEMIANRVLPVSLELLERRLDMEPEALVREALSRLLRAREGRR